MKKAVSLFVFSSLLAVLFSQSSVNFVTLATGYSSPVDIKNCGDQRLFIVEQVGYIRILYKDGTKQTTPFLNITSRVLSTGNEQGLLGLAFSPNYKQDGYFYVNYTYGVNGTSGYTHISRFSVYANDSTQADPNSEVIILSFSQPETNHNGGNLMFGPDGYLYDSQGDGGGGGDQHGTYGNGQNLNTYLGKMLRLNVTGQTTYTVPPANPFVGVPNTKYEIWAYGLRNPWRCSFDRLKGDLWIGDVGQDAYEEVDFQHSYSMGGENYGWRCYEGNHPYNTTGCASSTTMVFPIFEMPQAGTTNCAVTGGYVYRGAEYSRLFGHYLHSDFCSGRIWRTIQTGTNTFVTDSPTVYINGTQSFRTNNIGTFGEDNLGELYIGGRANGRIYHMTETSNCTPVAFISFHDSTQGCNPVTVAALKGDTLSYQWYNSNGTINGATSYQFAASQTGWYKIKVSKQQAGCEAMSDSVFVTVYDSTDIILTNPVLSTCVNSSNLDLTPNVNPSGGVFSGSGVSGTAFVSSAGVVGNNAISYGYTNLNGCHSNVNFSVFLNDTSVLTQSLTDTLACVSGPSFAIDGYVNPVGGIFSGNGVTGNSFNPATAGEGVNSISYTYANIANCVSTYSFNIEVGNATPLTKNISDSVFCDNESPVSLASYVSPAGGVYSGQGVTGTDFDPAAAAVGLNVIQYQYTNNYGCVSFDSFSLEVSICTTVSEEDENFTFNIFPNPTKRSFNLEIKTNSIQKAELSITDALGKVCFSKTQSIGLGKRIITVELPSLAKGIYSVQLKGQTGNCIKTLVIE